MKVEVTPRRKIQHPLRNDAAVGDDNNGIRFDRLQPGAELWIVLYFFRLSHRQARLHRQDLHRRRRRSLIAAAYAIRLGDHQLDAVPGPQQLFKRRNGELRSPTEDQPHGSLPVPGSLQLANLAQHKIALERTDAEDEENSVQVVNLMLKGTGQQVIGFAFYPIPL